MLKRAQEAWNKLSSDKQLLLQAKDEYISAMN